MTDSITYNVPVKMVEAFRGQSVIVRARLPSEIVERLSQHVLDDISYIQLLSVSPEVDDLVNWGEAIPLDVVMQSPSTEFPQLYKYAKLLENHPVRISIPVAAGFGKAAKLALALNFAVKLEMVGQPGADLIEELQEVLDLYLHRSTVSQPVEFFHSLFLAFYREERATLWAIQEEDPAFSRYVTDAGAEEAASRRLQEADAKGDISARLAEYQRELLTEQTECDGCEFFEHCGGYFKWPDKEYDCAGVKTLLGAHREAARELRGDVEAYVATQGEARL
jgi:hypothetical protein